MDHSKLIHENVRRKTKELSAHPENPRTHSFEQVQQLAKSIKTFGFTNPVLIDENNVIIAGHGRLQAAEALEMAELPCVLIKGLTPELREKLMTADNQLALNAGWDYDILERKLREWQGEEFDMDALGFGEFDLLEILGEEDDPDDDEENDDKKDGLGKPIIQYNIIFDTEEQQTLFQGFLRQLKADYPEEATVAARITAHIGDLDNG